VTAGIQDEGSLRHFTVWGEYQDCSGFDVDQPVALQRRDGFRHRLGWGESPKCESACGEKQQDKQE